MTNSSGHPESTVLKSSLQALGLSIREVELYLLLVASPRSRPAQLAKRLQIPRTTAQNMLLRMEREGFVMPARDDGAITYFATHPDNLKNQFARKKVDELARLQQLDEELAIAVPQLLGMMDTAKSIPQIRFYRGREGARAVLLDTLSSRTELRDFANIDAMFEVIPDINAEYVSKRESTTVTKRSLLLDTPFARKVYSGGRYSPKSHRGYKWIPPEHYRFSLEMNIYDGKISYLTYIREEIIGVIIENETIYEMQSALWNLLWDLLPNPNAKGAVPKKVKTR